jgi:glycerophosphoryl diester phosphodiesterase
MKKIILTLILCACCLYSQAQVAQLIKELHNAGSKNIMVIAHRGDWHNAPENSLYAYQRAIDLGVEMIEVDLEKSKDGVIIILHDHTLNRSTTGKGKPSDYTLAELKKFRLRDGLGAPTNNTIPTLEEVMQLAKGKVLVNLDHSFPYYREAYDILVKTGTLEQALFKTDEDFPKLQATYPELLDKITFMPVVDLDTSAARAQIKDYLQHMKPVATELVFTKDTSSVIQNPSFIKKAGIRVWVNTLWPFLNGNHNDDLAVEYKDIQNSWDWLLAHGVTMIQTDRPAELLQYLRKKHLHR